MNRTPVAPFILLFSVLTAGGQTQATGKHLPTPPHAASTTKIEQDAPLQVQVRTAPLSITESDELRRKEHDETQRATITLWLGVAVAVATIAQVVAVIIQILIYRKQTRIMRRSLTATRKAAEAARDSANAVAKIERPWVLIEKISITEDGTVNNRGRFTNLLPDGFKFVLRNYGRTPAKVTALAARIDIGDSGDVPPHPEMFSVEDALVSPHLIPQGDHRPHFVALDPPMSGKDELLILSGPLFLWAYALVRYTDVHGNIYESRVCFRNDPEANKCNIVRLDGPPEYNRIL